MPIAQPLPPPPTITKGDVIQIAQSFPVRAYAGAFVYVHEVFAWGVAGVVMAPKRHGEKPHPLGVTVPNEHFCRIGPSAWDCPPPAVSVVTTLPRDIDVGDAVEHVGEWMAGTAGVVTSASGDGKYLTVKCADSWVVAGVEMWRRVVVAAALNATVEPEKVAA